MTRIGILGGTFDPPHYAHLILAQHACEELTLDKVLFVPAGVPPHKTDRTPIEHRLAMLEAAIAGNPRFELSRVDVDRAGPHYTLDMVRILQQQNPGAALYFIMGEDTFRDLPNWHRPQELFATCQLVVAVMQRQRGERSDLRLDMHEPVIPGLKDRALMLSSPLVEFSSSAIIERIEQGRSVRYMLPESVWEYIVQHELYQSHRGISAP